VREGVVGDLKERGILRGKERWGKNISKLKRIYQKP
jgi:hypothetical protein